MSLDAKDAKELKSNDGEIQNIFSFTNEVVDHFAKRWGKWDPEGGAQMDDKNDALARLVARIIYKDGATEYNSVLLMDALNRSARKSIERDMLDRNNNQLFNGYEQTEIALRLGFIMGKSGYSLEPSQKLPFLIGYVCDVLRSNPNERRREAVIGAVKSKLSSPDKQADLSTLENFIQEAEKILNPAKS